MVISNKTKSLHYFTLFVLIIVTFAVNAEDVEKTNTIEEVFVWGSSTKSHEAGYTSPNSVLLPQDMESINAVTTEDLVKFEPSLVIRRRFIGDSNGTLGIRGSNMFQTSRSMVFADGVPLHYFLQSRWNGAPRWTMVSASEIEKVEVLYGPFSAEYGGNSMGGVVLIETGIPQKREFHANVQAFSQSMDAYGFDNSVSGYKGFVSYGDKIGDLSYYLSFNRLDNNAQPQTFRAASVLDTNDSSNATGGIRGLDARARDRYWYGDTGVVDTVTNNYKLKLGYDFGAWQSLLNIAFEGRDSQNTGNTYIRNNSGQPLWAGDDLVVNGQAFSFNSRRINANELERESVSVGLRIKGELTQSVKLEATLNQFDIRKDQQKSSALNPYDPAFDNNGQIRKYNNSGWQTAEVKLIVDDFAIENLEWVSGIRHENYELNLDIFNAPDYVQGIIGDYQGRFGGKTQTSALFSQFNWNVTDKLTAAFGLRYEDFSSKGGYYSESNASNNGLNLVYVPEANASKTSPKLSLGYNLTDTWLIRYSLAKAYRFPIVEELFRQYQAFNSINESNPDLKPEDGIHHNLLIEKTLDEGYLRVNIFQDNIKNAIESQSTTIVGGVNDGASVSTFVPLDKTRTRGVEFIANKYNVFIAGLDIRFNVTYTNAEILENFANTAWEGNVYPRMPKWRSNLLATYHISDAWNVGVNMQYASDSFGRIQNDDTIDKVYGAQDAYTRLGFKTSYAINESLSASLGIDNITNEVAYVAHPWPGRTVYLNFSYAL